MIRFVMVFLVILAAVFTLFWHIRNWKLAVAKKTGLILICLLASAIVTVGIAFGVSNLGW